MKLEIRSFDSLQQRAARPFLPGTALISICDPDMDRPVLAHQPDHCLQLTFDDLVHEQICKYLELPAMAEEDLERLLSKQHNTILFSRELAETTADFICEHVPSASVLICQCLFGQSRSAAVAAAVAEFYWGKGHLIFDQPRYSPNPLVYSRLLDALRKKGK